MSGEAGKLTRMEEASAATTAASPGLLEDGVELTFPDGLVGCPTWKRFVFRTNPEQAPIHTLESLDDPDVSLFVLDPYLINEDYAIEMAEADQASISLEHASDAIVFVILVMRHDPLAVTANLLGPLVINSRSKLGCQLVLENADYSVRHLVYSEASEEGGKEDAA